MGFTYSKTMGTAPMELPGWKQEQQNWLWDLLQKGLPKYGGQLDTRLQPAAEQSINAMMETQLPYMFNYMGTQMPKILQTGAMPDLSMYENAVRQKGQTEASRATAQTREELGAHGLVGEGTAGNMEARTAAKSLLGTEQSLEDTRRAETNNAVQRMLEAAGMPMSAMQGERAMRGEEAAGAYQNWLPTQDLWQAMMQASLGTQEGGWTNQFDKSWLARILGLGSSGGGTVGLGMGR